MDPVPAFHDLEALVSRRDPGGPAADRIAALRARLGDLRGAEPEAWSAFYGDALSVLDQVVPDSGPAGALSAAERRYAEALLGDVVDAPQSADQLWQRRLQDQRDELLGKAREEADQLQSTVSAGATELTVAFRRTEVDRWRGWLDHYLGVWSERVTSGVPQDIEAAAERSLSRAPEPLAARLRPLPAVPAVPPPTAHAEDWPALESGGELPSAWTQFTRSARGGLFAVMTLATLVGGAAAAFGAGGGVGRGAIVLGLLVPALVWARVSSQRVRATAQAKLQERLEAQLRARLLEVTRGRVEAKQRTLRGWVQRQTQEARSEAVAWSRAHQLALSDTAVPSGADERWTRRASELRNKLERRRAELGA